MSGEDFFDRLYSDYCVPFPCFALRSPTGSGLAVEPAGDGTRSLVILTDEDLLTHYQVVRLGAANMVPVRIVDPAAMADIVAWLPSEITHVAFDPTPGFHRRYPVAAVRASLALLVK